MVEILFTGNLAKRRSLFLARPWFCGADLARVARRGYGTGTGSAARPGKAPPGP